MEEWSEGDKREESRRGLEGKGEVESEGEKRGEV